MTKMVENGGGGFEKISLHNEIHKIRICASKFNRLNKKQGILENQNCVV